MTVSIAPKELRHRHIFLHMYDDDACLNHFSSRDLIVHTVDLASIARETRESVLEVCKGMFNTYSNM